jgi:hypothetical protein
MLAGLYQLTSRQPLPSIAGRGSFRKRYISVLNRADLLRESETLADHGGAISSNARFDEA